MSSLNQCQFIGRLGADPEIRSMNSGAKVANLRLAVTETWKDKQSGERKESTVWVPVTIWTEGLVGVVERFLTKGSRCYVSGKFETRKWQDQEGNDRYSTEIVLRGPDAKLVLLDGKGDGAGEREELPANGNRQAPSSYHRAPPRSDPRKAATDRYKDIDLDESIPF